MKLEDLSLMPQVGESRLMWGGALFRTRRCWALCSRK